MSARGPDGTFQPGNDAAVTHGAYRTTPLLRELLADEERMVWDEAPVPAGCTGAIELVFRRQHVMRHRLDKWGGQKIHETSSLPEVFLLTQTLERPDRVTLKAMEVEIRARETIGGETTDEETERFFASMSPEQLSRHMIEGEMPLRDPSTGQLLLPPPIEEDDA